MKTKTDSAPSLPSQTELATLAAALPSGTAADRVMLAFEIWQASSKPWELELAFYKDRSSAIESKLDETSRMLISPLSKALETILPDERPAARPEKWKLFRAWQQKNGVDAPSFEDDKRIGVFFYLGIFAEIKAWEAEERKSVAKEKASKAGKARWDKEPAGKRREGKAGGKTQQVKKRAKS